MVTQQVVLPRPDHYVDVAIVGAGFSGSMVAVHLAQTLPGARQIALVEKRRRAGPGVAYSTDNPLHLLNVPAGRMGAYPDRPRHFFEWLKEHPALINRHRLDRLTEGTFVPRRLYGLYLELLVQRCALRGGRVRRFEREAVDLAEAPDGSLRLSLADGIIIFARKVVLALGNFPPGDPVISDQHFHRSLNYLSDPWSPSTLQRLSEAKDILILGSGLTALEGTPPYSPARMSGKYATATP